MSWSEEIYELRTRLNLTQREVAQAVGVTDQTISNWENGIYQPRLTLEQTLALCQVLQISLEELVALTKKNKPQEQRPSINTDTEES